MTTLQLERAERIARTEAPYPYASPLAAEVREAHVQLMKRAFGRYLLWGYLVGTPGFLALFVPLVFGEAFEDAVPAGQGLVVVAALAE